MDPIYFFGRFHVLALHLPIGIIVAAVALQWLARRPRYRQLASTVPFLWTAAAVAAIVTALLGYMHFAEGGFSGRSATLHRAYGTAVAVLATLIWLASTRYTDLYRRFGLAAGLLLLVLVTFTGHYGGNLTHGSTYLWAYAPAPVRTLMGSEAAEAPVTSMPNDLADASADASTVQALYDAGFLVRQQSTTDAALSVSVYSPGAALQPAQLATLLSAADRIVELNLDGAAIDDAALGRFGRFTNLRRLRLSSNDITDAGLPALAGLAALESLNLYGNTGVTDSGLESLLSLGALQELYVWQTGVSAAGAARFQSRRPTTRVQLGTADSLQEANAPSDKAPAN